jgi:hemerythrin-like metal-binding protein
MPLIEWTDDMSVGLTELDNDHKLIIEAINQLDANANDATRKDVVRQCLMRLRRYAEYHFAREEKVMAACAFPAIEVQKSEHRDFVKRVQEVTRRFDAQPAESAEIISQELLGFLRDWLRHHILIEDMAYRSYVENSGAAKQAARSFKGAEIWWSQ